MLACAIAALCLTEAATAATIPVTTTEDVVAAGGGKCSLRGAVIAANTDTAQGGCPAGSGADKVTVPGGEYKLTISPASEGDPATGDLDVTAPVEIAGEGAATTTIRGAYKGMADRIVAVHAPDVVITGVVIRDGSTEQSGGGIAVGSEASVTVSGSVITGNAAYSGGGVAVFGGAALIEGSTISDSKAVTRGGGISSFSNGGAVVIRRSRISSNDAVGGAGIFANGGRFEVLESTVSENGSFAHTDQGGGLEIDGGPTTVADSAVTGNIAWNVGAGIFSDVRPTSSSTVLRTEVSGNELAAEGLVVPIGGAGVYDEGALTITDSWIHDNNALNDNPVAKPKGPASIGGGVEYEPREAGEPLVIEGSTVGPGNTAAGGDGLFLRAPFKETSSVSLVRSTVVGNGPDGVAGQGGGVYLASGVIATFRDVTLAQNKASSSGGGGNLYAVAPAGLTFENTLIAQPFGGGDCEYGAAGNPTVLGGNQQYGDGGTPESCRLAGAGDLASGEDLTEAELHGPTENGGPTPTMALAPGALPIDTGAGCQATDQRGVPRPQGPACDSGAYELDTTPLHVTIDSGPSGEVTMPAVSFAFSANQPATFKCALDGAAPAPCSSPFNAGPLPLGPHSFTVVGTDIPGKTASASRSFTVVPPPLGGGSAGGGSTGGASLGSGAATPRISGASQTNAVWREGNRLSVISRRRAPLGTIFAFQLSNPATVTMSFTQALPGRLVKGRCVRAGAHARGRHCKRSVVRGSLSFAGHRGRDALAFQGRVSRAVKLEPGRYTLLISAANASGRSNTSSLSFTIVR